MAAFSLNSPEKDDQETDLRSEDAASQSLEKLDVSKESSGTSTRSDQTTLEYQDAPSPGDLEDLSVASKPASSSTELITNVTEQAEKDGDTDVLESEVTPPDLEKQMGKDSFPNKEFVTEFFHGKRSIGTGESRGGSVLACRHSAHTRLRALFCP